MRVLEERGKGVIVFDYGVSTVRFGLWLDPAEARQIVALLKERFGQYMAGGKVEASS
jgi:NOL1/NOP2/fmu family ribosome biogenesis protein